MKEIKKLKRWNVDVNKSNAPLPTFLKDELCSVAYHLAIVSRYDSEQWKDSLVHFEHWSNLNSDAEKNLDEYIQQLPLRIVGERDDTDCPLVKDQIAGRHLSMRSKSTRRFVAAGQGNDNDAPTTEVSIIRIPPIETYSYPPIGANFAENGYFPHQGGFNMNNQYGISHPMPMHHPTNNVYSQNPFVFFDGIQWVQCYQHHGPHGVVNNYVPANQYPNNFGYMYSENGMHFYH